MLDSMRRNANSWVFTLLFAIIIFVFAVNFGPWAGRQTTTESYAAVVNGHIIGLNELNVAVMNMAAGSRGGVSADQIRAHAGMLRLALDGLIEREYFAQLAEANNLVVTDEQLVASIDELLGSGKSVSNAEYKKIIEAQLGMKVEDFERMHRRQMLAGIMRDAIARDIAISESDLKMSYYLRNDKVAVSYIRIDPAHFEGKDKSAQMAQAKQYALEIVNDLNSGKKLDQVTHKDLIKKEKGVMPTAKDVAPVYAESELFARLDSGFAPAFVEASFKLSEGSFTKEPVEVDGKIYVIAFKQKEGAKESNFAKEKDMFRLMLANQRSNTFLRGLVDKLRKNSPPEYNEALFRKSAGDAPVEG